MNTTKLARMLPAEPSLLAQSPFELRVDLGCDVPETDVRAALANGDVGFLHSYTTGSTVDGPGVRVVAWTTSCNWRCKYCHNPDTWTMANGIPVTIARATQELQKYRTGLKVMSGGFTLSGGEPLMQDRFTVKLLAAARAMGIHTALDTNGSLGERVSDDELKNIDLVLLDIKGWDAERHRQITGNDISPVLNFARRLAARNRPMWIRFVLVPKLTDDLGDIAHIARFAASLGSVVQRVQVLPFHQMGKYKWKALNLDYNLESVSAPSLEQVQSVSAEFRALGLQTD